MRVSEIAAHATQLGLITNPIFLNPTFPRASVAALSDVTVSKAIPQGTSVSYPITTSAQFQAVAPFLLDAGELVKPACSITKGTASNRDTAHSLVCIHQYTATDAMGMTKTREIAVAAPSLIERYADYDPLGGTQVSTEPAIALVGDLTVTGLIGKFDFGVETVFDRSLAKSAIASVPTVRSVKNGLKSTVHKVTTNSYTILSRNPATDAEVVATSLSTASTFTVAVSVSASTACNNYDFLSTTLPNSTDLSASSNKSINVPTTVNYSVSLNKLRISASFIQDATLMRETRLFTPELTESIVSYAGVSIGSVVLADLDWLSGTIVNSVVLRDYTSMVQEVVGPSPLVRCGFSAYMLRLRSILKRLFGMR